MYIVYVARYGDKVMYVGEGKRGREKHVTSGTSHLYEANRYHFRGMVVDVEVLEEVETKEEAVSLENKYIADLAPVWNKKDKGFDCINLRKLYKDILSKIVEDRVLTAKSHISLMEYIVTKVKRDGKCSIGSQELSLIGMDIKGTQKILSYISRDGVRNYSPKKLSRLAYTENVGKGEYLVYLTDYFKDYMNRKEI